MPCNIPRPAYFLTAFCLLMGTIARADSVNYDRDIKPILKTHCYACHGALKQQANLRLDTGSLIRQGGDSGPAVVAKQPAASLLIERVTAAALSERMPPEGEPLTAAQIDLLRAWISQGTTSPDVEHPEADPRHHWAFQSPRRSAIPAVNASVEVHNPIDVFLDAERAKHGLTSRPAAPKQVLLRRVSIDLIGLPPTRDELLAFLADESTNAYERVVDRLLADPRYGERWGRHWMDIWRYSDWYGRRDVNDVRNSASQIYRWRDWIVRSLNEGKGYDRMIQEMLAADEICPEDYEAGVATGYLIRNYYSLNPNDWMRSAVEHTGKAFLGLTFNCAHCHDHKYDPIAHDDYFRLRAFFEPVFIRQDRVPGEADPGLFQDYTYAGSRSVQRLGAVRVFDKRPDAPTWFYTDGDERNHDKQRGSIPPGVPAFLTKASLRIEPVKLPPRAWYPGLRPAIQATLLAEARAAFTRAESELAAVNKIGIAVPQAALDQLARVEADYAAAVQEAQGSHPDALAGQQSLLLDATAGRRIVQNGLKQLKSFDAGAALKFQLQIVRDAHVNFQFVKHRVKGLTAGYLAFEQGRIMAYRSGKPGDSEIGTYDFNAGQNRFEVSFVMQPAEDRALLTIRCGSDKKVLVDDVPVALNGWTPLGDPNKTISFDARTGSVAAIDDVVWLAPRPAGADLAEVRLASFDFEPPKYTEGQDVTGIDGWEGSSFSKPPATSVVSTTAGNPALRDVSLKLRVARRATRTPVLPLQAAEAQLEAARAELSSVEARIRADRAKFDEHDAHDTPAHATDATATDATATDAAKLAQVASHTERQATLRKAEAEILAKQRDLAIAETKPADDAKRDKEIETATSGLIAARTAARKARAALADESMAAKYSPLSPVYPRQSTGRRRALAAWITSRDNPLTARVAVNHIWTRHFHSPLVASMVDFGRNGARPTHPALLDWLAVEFVESGWDMRGLHRRIVTTDAYRRVSSTGDSQTNVTADPENTLLWRMNAARMESEVVRDSLLYIAGQLDATMGGVELENDKALTTNRRSLYYSVYPESGGKSALGELFDAPDPLDCYRRTSSIIPQQALALTNSDLVHQSSVACVRAWQQSQSQSVEREGDAETQRFIVAMFQLILSRRPTAAEQRICRDALQRQQQLAAKPESVAAILQSRQSLVRILLNHNDFLTVR